MAFNQSRAAKNIGSAMSSQSRGGGAASGSFMGRSKTSSIGSMAGRQPSLSSPAAASMGRGRATTTRDKQVQRKSALPPRKR